MHSPWKIIPLMVQNFATISCIESNGVASSDRLHSICADGERRTSDPPSRRHDSLYLA